MRAFGAAVHKSPRMIDRRKPLGPVTLALGLLTFATGGLVEGCHGGGGPSQVSRTIGRAGGTVTASDGSSIDVPPGALASPTTITMEAATPSALPGGGVSGGAAYALGPAGQTFLVPATITLTFDPKALPSMTQGSDLAVFTTSVGTTDHAYWLATRLVDATHVSAETSHFSWAWVGDPRRYAAQTGPPPTTCGISGAACLNFDLDEAGFCALCQCADGNECPGGDPSQCCGCSDGTPCPQNDARLCAQCDAGALAPVVAGVPSQSLGSNCTLDADLCFVCPSTNPVACASGLCCPLDHGTCCGDTLSCGVTSTACINADAGAPEDSGSDDAGATSEAGLEAGD
jgi:hypothetical protein